MKFGKLPDISGVDFSLPADPNGNHSFLQNLNAPSDTATVYIGCTGWSMKEWVGRVYPPGTKSGDFLKEYAKQFNTIELNTTHYRIPSFSTIERWYKESTPDFRFCPKIPQSISHKANLGLDGPEIALFAESVSGLQEKLGPCFMQFPPYFDTDRFMLLERFLNAFPTTIKLAVELRHASWFEPHATERLSNLLRQEKIGWVITDVAGRRDVLHQQLTHDFAMVRFVGNGLDPTDYNRIDDWVTQIQNWTSQGLPEVFFFTHEPDNILAPDLSLYLRDQLVAKTSLETRGPSFFGEDQGQMTLF